MKIIKIFPLLVFLLAIYGCSLETSRLTNKGDLIVPKRIGQTGRYLPDYQAMRKEAGQAYAAGLKKIMQESALSVGEVWVLSEILKYEPNIALREFQARSVDKLTGDPFLRLITPTAPLSDLPVDPGTGTVRFYAYMLAPFGTPEERAISYLNDFLSTPETGYALTHQFLALHWAAQVGLKHPEKLFPQKQYLLERIHQEQVADPFFSDLFAERTALLFHFSNPGSNDVIQWVRAVLDAQLPDGTWGRHSAQLSYDGQSVTVHTEAAHTSALALLILRIFLDMPST